MNKPDLHRDPPAGRRIEGGQLQRRSSQDKRALIGGRLREASRPGSTFEFRFLRRKKRSFGSGPEGTKLDRSLARAAMHYGRPFPQASGGCPAEHASADFRPLPPGAGGNDRKKYSAMTRLSRSAQGSLQDTPAPAPMGEGRNKGFRREVFESRPAHADRSRCISSSASAGGRFSTRQYSRPSLVLLTIP